MNKIYPSLTVSFIISVSSPPGHFAITFMLLPSFSLSILSVKPFTPNLLAQYADRFEKLDFPALELILTLTSPDLFPII
ncbi:MAG TPA: hypothetical protein VJ697_02370 [Nitrososphaeraceae archaeon]|nr:hypothetical protein [Nitrososphaeraceae archaeon]